ncbi:uncharacterized protein [Miscanthus floridulus]|uniref:uncharacterized protein n=1 Tax=Miscanthus floridulus TaxID=154761 RepID=UPI0034588B0A
MVMRETDKADKKGNIDEIKQYRDARWVTPPEALWRIYGFDLSKNHPLKRKNSVFQVGRVISAHPAKGERYFLCVLLNNIAGSTSYKHLRTVDGMLLPSFHEVVERRGLIEEDNTLDECLTEATLFQMPSSLRRLFATILVFCEPHDVTGLWKKYYDTMSEDYNPNHPSPDLVQQMVLIDIRNMLQYMGKDIRSFPLLDIDHSYDDASHISREIFEEASVEQNPEDVLLCDSLNAEQRSAYDEIMAAICSKQEVNGDDNVRIPNEICVPYSGDAEKDLHTLIDIIFADLNANMADKVYITTRGGETVYHSFDSAVDDPHNYYPSEFLNSLTPNGLPPHVLKLKLGCPVILLRNIDPANGPCNGTRLVVRGFRRNTINAEIVVGQHAGKRVFLPRISLCPPDDEMFPFQFKRKQFPIRLSFAMTVNKSQGQTIPNVGVYLPAPVFSHGQLYVAMSRATSKTNIKILALSPDAEAQEEEAKKIEKKNAKKNVEGKI